MMAAALRMTSWDAGGLRCKISLTRSPTGQGGVSGLPAEHREALSSLDHVLRLLVIHTASMGSDRNVSCPSGVTYLRCHCHHTRHGRLKGSPGCAIMGKNLVWTQLRNSPPIRRYLERHREPVSRLPLAVLDHDKQLHIFKLSDEIGRLQRYIIVTRSPNVLPKAPAILILEINWYRSAVGAQVPES